MTYSCVLTKCTSIDPIGVALPRSTCHLAARRGRNVYPRKTHIAAVAFYYTLATPASDSIAAVAFAAVAFAAVALYISSDGQASAATVRSRKE